MKESHETDPFIASVEKLMSGVPVETSGSNSGPIEGELDFLSRIFDLQVEGNRLGDYTIDQTRCLVIAVSNSIEELPDRESRLVRSLYGFAGSTPQHLLSYADEIGVTSERVLQIENKIIAKFKHPNKLQQLLSASGLIN